jgi:flagellar hook-associated protein 1
MERMNVSNALCLILKLRKAGNFMRSTFHGLETARRALSTQQTAIQTTGHNIANASTPGYSRQRVNFQQEDAYPGNSFIKPQIPGQIGTGVKAGSIQRIREDFLDLQYRGENNKFGYWDARSEALGKMEEVLKEPSDTGLKTTMDRFWQSLQDLAVNPDNSGARSVVRERGIALSETFNYLSTSLQSIRKDIKSQLEVTKDEINSIAVQINNLNQQIAAVEPHKYLPNDLYDQRDALVDKLSQMVDIKITNIDSGEGALDIAEGSYNIDIVGKDGSILGTLVDARTRTVNEFKINDPDNDSFIDSVSIGVGTIDVDKFSSQGKVLGLIESYGYEYETTDTAGNITTVEKGTYPDMLADLDSMAYEIVTAFNQVHEEAYGMDGTTTGTSFFESINQSGAAGAIKLHDDILADGGEFKIATSLDGNPGDGSNAINLADILKGKSVTLSDGTTVKADFSYENIIGQMAVDAQQAMRLRENSDNLRVSVEGRRQSVSGVSLDEEMTNLVQFQHAYNAAARTITAVDEMLDTIINGMGRVGR